MASGGGGVQPMLAWSHTLGQSIGQELGLENAASPQQGQKHKDKMAPNTLSPS